VGKSFFSKPIRRLEPIERPAEEAILPAFSVYADAGSVWVTKIYPLLLSEIFTLILNVSGVTLLF
jgi:hypothetical protein